MIHLLEPFLVDNQRINSPLEAQENPNNNDVIAGTFARTNNQQGIGAQPDGSFYVRLLSVDITGLSVDQKQEKKQLSHAFASSLANRTVQIKGELVAKDALGQQKGVQTLKNIFRLDETPSLMNRSSKKLSFTLQDGGQWYMFGQIDKKGLVVSSDTWQNQTTNFEVTFMCEDPRIFSEDIFDFEIQEGHIGGVMPGRTLGQDFGFDAQHAVTAHNYTGVALAPMKITITATDDLESSVPEIKQLSTQKYVRLATAIKPKDTLVIDSFAGAIYLNGAERNDLLVAGSRFPTLTSGNNDVVLVDHTSPLHNGGHIKATAEYRKVLV